MKTIHTLKIKNEILCPLCHDELKMVGGVAITFNGLCNTCARNTYIVWRDCGPKEESLTENGPIKILTEIQSMHEQREQFNFGLQPIKEGTWIEVVKFDYNTEAADIHLRLEVKEIHKVEFKEVTKYRIVTKKLKIEDDERAKEEIINKILKKHNPILKASFCRCLIDGVSLKSIPELKGMMYKLGGSKNG